MMLQGKVHKFGDDINTDYIISGKRKFDTLDMKFLTQYLMEDIRPGFYKEISEGDFIVGGSNFGCGSSREYAPTLIKTAGISAVLAKSFARIFFRNSMNIGLPLIECDTDGIDQGDHLEVQLSNGVIMNKTKGTKIVAKLIPDLPTQILRSGGLIKFYKAKGLL
ncbi:MAG TPA: 3-isopropylmalate dehydratase small subunit [Corynebacteriales bacterium]|nr:3-isopropylmalate dehydratase small subunit [Mycobacteriales bacterium]